MHISSDRNQPVLLWDIKNRNPCEATKESETLFAIPLDIPTSMIFYLPLDPFKPAVVKFYSTKPVSHLALPDLFTDEDLANSLAVTVYKTALSAKSCISSRLH